MKRYNKSDFEVLGDVSSGTAAAFIGKNKKTGKKGVYKDNGCMLGFTNDDVREKLSSDILKTVGIKCADIDLVYDEELNQNACFSNYVINDDEILLEPTIYYNHYNGKDEIENFVENYAKGVKDITDNETFLDKSKANAYSYIYMSCLLDLYDIKADNLPIV